MHSNIQFNTKLIGNNAEAHRVNCNTLGCLSFPCSGKQSSHYKLLLGQFLAEEPAPPFKSCNTNCKGQFLAEEPAPPFKSCNTNCKGQFLAEEPAPPFKSCNTNCKGQFLAEEPAPPFKSCNTNCKAFHDLCSPTCLTTWKII